MRNKLDSRELILSHLEYDPISGVLKWKETGKGRRSDKIAGSINGNGYIQIRLAGTIYLAHRLAWLCVTGEWPENHIDHINGDRSDNRLINLREATPLENAQNNKLRSDNTSGFIGVSAHKASGKWTANIRVNGALRYLGLFDDLSEAKTAYLSAKKDEHLFQPVPRHLLSTP